MAPPAYTDPQKWNAMRALADEYLDDAAVESAGLLDTEGVHAAFALHEDPSTSAATQVQLDAIINHMLGVQILHSHFVDRDIPKLARDRARELGWLQ
jgi:asparagine synthase (glutamine-hydrolysing)